VAKYWIEALAGCPAGRGRQRIPLPQARGAAEALFVTISQSGETADTLAALRIAKDSGYANHAGHLQRARRARWCASPTWCC
jgi:glucosamine--fructose-6-phosphate aminotransferase (isomerizing)